ncbi:MAG: hypothetical protein ACYC35_29055 [Pirellulales bacterium]
MIEFSRPMSPKELRRIFGVSQGTIRRRLASQQLRNRRLHSNAYRIAIADLPADYRRLLPAGL